MSGSDDFELMWKNKHLRLQASGDDGYGWVAAGDSSNERILSFESVGRVGDNPSREQGILVVGDALDVLTSLPSHKPARRLLRRGVRLVYIDPPFNTRQGFGHYSDALGHPEWLSMLRDRLLATKRLLSPLGSVWVHLDDAEAHRARCVLDEVFGVDAFVATVVWQKRTTRDSRAAFSNNHDYIHVYAPAGPQVWKRSRNLLAADTSLLRNRDDDPRGPWTDAPFTAPGFRANQQYAIVNPAGKVLRPPKGRSWYATEPVYKALRADNRIWFPRAGSGLPRIKLFTEHIRGRVPFSIWDADECGTNDDATRHLMSLFPEDEPFATPKPEALLQRIIHVASDPGDLVLDCFAGSGTTAAVAHKMGRRWIAIERSRTTVAKFAYPRLQRVVAGDDPGGITHSSGWTGGGAFSLVTCASSKAGSSNQDQLDSDALVG